MNFVNNKPKIEAAELNLEMILRHINSLFEFF